MPPYGDFQRRRQHSATTAHRALPVCEWPVLDMIRGIKTSTLGSAVRSRFGGVCTGCIGRARQVVLGGVQFC